MNIKRMIIKVAIDILAENTTLIRKTDPLSASIYSMFGIEKEEDRIARVLDEESARVIEAAKKINTNRKFKKITEDF